MQRISKLLLPLLMIFMACASYADEPAEDQYAVLQDTMKNTSNQFIYSFFGKELLMMYLEDDVAIKAVEAADPSELGRLSAPFNSVTGSFVLGGLTLVYWLVVLYLGIRVALFVSEVVWLSQRKGAAIHSQAEYRGIALKMMVFVALAAFPFRMENPMIGDKMVTSVGNALLFDLMGRAHIIGDDALEKIVLDQRQTLATVELPNPDAKWASGKALNAFMTCLRMDGSRQKKEQHVAELVLYDLGAGSVSGDLVQGRCTLRVNFGVDLAGDAKIAEMRKITPSLALSDTVFADGQKAVFAEVLSTTFEKAFAHSKHLALPEEIETGTDRQDQETQYIMRHWTIDGRSLQSLGDWQADCERWPTFTVPHGRMSNTDKALYQLLSSRCLSKDITEALLYPETTAALDTILLNGERRQKTLPLCVDTALFAQQSAASRFVPVYDSGLVSTGEHRFEEVALNSCLVNLCSAASITSGGMYACNGALDAYEDRMRDVSVSERGIMMLGLHMFNLFTHTPPSATAKNVYNRTAFRFEIDGAVRGELGAGEVFLKVPVTLPKTDVINRHHSFLSDLWVVVSAGEAKPLPLIDAPNQLQGGVLGLFGYSRLATCLRNPLQIENGYVCGNIPEEFSRFGMTVMRSAVALKSLLMAGDAIRHSRQMLSADGASAMGSDVKSGVVAKIGGVVSAVAIPHLVDNLLDSTISGTDDFGFLDQTRMRDISASGSVFAAAAATTFGFNSTIAGFFDSALLFAVLIGFLFAIVIPLFPMILVIFALSKFIYLLVKTLFLNGFNLVDAAFETETDMMSTKIDQVWADWLSLILKLPLTIAGVVLAWLMSNVVIASVTKNMGFTTLYLDRDAGPIDAIVVIAVSLGVVFVIYNTIMTVIESFYDFTVDWVLGQMTDSPFSQRTAVNMQDASSVMQLIGRR